MSKTIKLGMLFESDNVPNFGSIERNPLSNSIFLIAEDIPKLNTTLTETACSPYLADNSKFNFHTGDTAYIVDWITAQTGPVYIYHSTTDQGYEMIPNE